MYEKRQQNKKTHYRRVKRTVTTEEGENESNEKANKGNTVLIPVFDIKP